MSCRACETIVQAPMPSLPIERGRPGPALLAHVLMSKFGDHQPLHRQADIYARTSFLEVIKETGGKEAAAPARTLTIDHVVQARTQNLPGRSLRKPQREAKGLARRGAIEISLPNGTQVSVDGEVDEEAVCLV